jgi:hypothetical protein
LSWDEIVQNHLTLLEQNPAIKTAYRADSDYVTVFGLPMGYMDYGDFAVLRTQRTVFQQWKVDAPWASAGQVVMANGGDVAKEAGLFPDSALTPISDSSSAITQPSDPGDNPAPTPVPIAGPVINPGVGYGMCVDPNNNLNLALAKMTQAGFNWAKVQIRWEHVESTPGNIDWGMMDSVVNTAQAHGVKLLFSVVTAPAWARAGQDLSHQGPPTNYQDYADFVGAIASRYAGVVDAYEIWNEQNYYAEWGGHGQMNAAQYVELLRLARNSIKAADPSAIIVSGGLTPGGNVGDLVIDDVLFMEQMFQAGLNQYADVIGVHANVAANNPPDDVCCGPEGRQGHWSFFWKRFTQHYDIMQRYGAGNKQIWFTEFGWASIQNVASVPQPGYEYAAEISEADQAAYLVRAYELARTQYSYLGVMMVWNLNYNGGPGDEKSAWSVLRADWSHRPAYDSLAAMPRWKTAP